MGFCAATRAAGLCLAGAFGHAATRRAGSASWRKTWRSIHRPAENLVRFYGALKRPLRRDLTRRTEASRAVSLLQRSNRNVGEFSAASPTHWPGVRHRSRTDLLHPGRAHIRARPLARYAVQGNGLLELAEGVGKTIFLSSQLLSEVELVCDRIAVLNKGRVVRSARPLDLLESRAHFEI